MARTLERKFNKALKRHMPRKTEDSDTDGEFSAKMSQKAMLTTLPRISTRPSRAASSRAKEAIHYATEEFQVWLSWNLNNFN